MMMKTLVDKLKETVKVEQNKISNIKNLKEFDQLIAQMDKLGYTQKAVYSFPLVDTIGKTTYTTLNKHSI
jgi:DUF438 domain-containing protein